MPVSGRAQHIAFLASMSPLEAKLKSQIIVDKNNFIGLAAARYAEHGTINFFDLVDKHQVAVFNTLKANYPRIIKVFGTLALGHIKTKSFKSTEEDSLFTELANDWIHTEGLKRSKLIADTSEADVLNAISGGIDDGLGTAEIARSIAGLTDLSPWRANTVAQTEVHQAATYANAESVRHAQDKLGVVMEKAWSPTFDNRTRPDHAAMDDSNYIPIDDKFIVGGEEADRPGDPALSPEESINCRCVQIQREAEQ